jgi:hypothetical protein
MEPSPLLLRPFIGLLYQPCLMDGRDFVANGVMDNLQGKLEYLEKTFLSDALFTTNPT